MLRSGDWKEDFFDSFEVREGVVQTCHVFVGYDSSEPARAEPVGFAMSAEAFGSYLDGVH